MSGTRTRLVNRNSRIRKIISFDKTTGCDVDSQIVVVANFDRKSECFETKEFDNNFKGANQAVEYIKKFGSQKILLESTSTYHILFYEIFQRNGLPVGILNPAKISKLLKVEGKNDKADARNIAMLAASFDLKVSNMPDLVQRRIRENTHSLDKLKQTRTQLSNRINTKLTAYGCNVFRKTKVNSKSGLAIIQAIFEGKSKQVIFDECWFGSQKSIPLLWDAFGEKEMIPEFIYPFLKECWDEIVLLNSRIEKREAECLDLIEELNLTELVILMVTIPIINDLLALRIIGEMGADFPIRYPNSEAFANAIGVVPRNEVSGGKVLKKGQEKGNKHLKIPLLNTVKSAMVRKDFDHPWKDFFLSIKGKSGFKRAVSAVAKRMMYVLYAVVRDNKSFDSEMKSLWKERKTFIINQSLKYVKDRKSMADILDSEVEAEVSKLIGEEENEQKTK